LLAAKLGGNAGKNYGANRKLIRINANSEVTEGSAEAKNPKLNRKKQERIKR